MILAVSRGETSAGGSIALSVWRLIKSPIRTKTNHPTLAAAQIYSRRAFNFDRLSPKLVPITFPSLELVTIEIGSAVTKINDGMRSSRILEEGPNESPSENPLDTCAIGAHARTRSLVAKAPLGGFPPQTCHICLDTSVRVVFFLSRHHLR